MSLTDAAHRAVELADLTLATRVARVAVAAGAVSSRRNSFWALPAGSLHQRDSTGLSIPFDEVVHESPHEVKIGPVVGSCKCQRELLLGGARQR